MNFVVITPEQLAEIIERATAEGAKKGIAEGLEIQSGKDELLNRQEAAKLMKVKPCTIDKWRAEGLIPVYYIGKTIRFKRSDFFNFDPYQQPRY